MEQLDILYRNLETKIEKRKRIIEEIKDGRSDEKKLLKELENINNEIAKLKKIIEINKNKEKNKDENVFINLVNQKGNGEDVFIKMVNEKNNSLKRDNEEKANRPMKQTQPKKKGEKHKMFKIVGAAILTVGMVYTMARGVQTIKNVMQNNERNKITENIACLNEGTIDEAYMEQEQVSELEEIKEKYFKFRKYLDDEIEIDRKKLKDFSYEILDTQMDIIKGKIAKEYMERTGKKEPEVTLAVHDINENYVCVAKVNGDIYVLDDVLSIATIEIARNKQTIKHFDEHKNEKIIDAQGEYIVSLTNAAKRGVEVENIGRNREMIKTEEIDNEKEEKLGDLEK